MTDHSCPVTRGKFQRSPLNLILPVAIQTSLRNPNTVPPFYFSYIVVISFIGGGNRRTKRKPPTCRMSLTNFITKCIEYTSPLAAFELTTLVAICSKISIFKE
jgi:hypothetical protein